MSAESLNTCTLSGNLGNDAEVMYTAGGMAITSFSLAVNHRRKQQDGSYADKTSWVDCTIFGKRGESLQANGYLQKGAKLAVVGHLRMSTWEADGQRRRAACMGGLLSVLDGDVRLVATTWEWAEDIDQARAEASKKRAEEILARKNLNDREYELAQARLKRALVRTSVR